MDTNSAYGGWQDELGEEIINGEIVPRWPSTPRHSYKDLAIRPDDIFADIF